MPQPKRPGLWELFLQWQEASILVVAVLLIGYFEVGQPRLPAVRRQPGEPVAVHRTRGDHRLRRDHADDHGRDRPVRRHGLRHGAVHHALCRGCGRAGAARAGGGRRGGGVGGAAERAGDREAGGAVLRHHARHAVPGQWLHVDDLGRHAGRTAGRGGARPGDGSMGLQRDPLGARYRGGHARRAAAYALGAAHHGRRRQPDRRGGGRHRCRSAEDRQFRAVWRAGGADRDAGGVSDLLDRSAGGRQPDHVPGGGAGGDRRHARWPAGRERSSAG